MKELPAIDGSRKSMTATMPPRNGNTKPPSSLPLVVSLNCLEDCSFEQEFLAGIATVEHVGLSRLADGLIESAAAVILQSLAFLPRAAQRRLQPWQLILCLGSSDRSVDSALAADLGLRLVHVDASRAEEIADTVMALFLGLLRRTHLLSRHAFSSSGWLGSVQPLCRGMRRCRALVLGIVGRSASARALATRSLAFKMSVLYFDVHEGKGKSGRPSITFPSAARRMDTLNDLLAASDLISLHCALSNETVQIINAECLQHIKPGAFIVNTGSSQLLDDCALKQLLIDGTIAGCALDGAEGPQWMEAWVMLIFLAEINCINANGSSQGLQFVNLKLNFIFVFQINRRMEFVFASHSFDVWESWTLEGSFPEACRLVNCRNPLAILDVHIDILATVGDDGVARWLDYAGFMGRTC
ncbi:C-terminal binding protein AN-like [Macadamia integrifolia]|uniref:C-terminal binding protein AN-like n=1 Tax=Macadamia integrifolia TaxID=60698 RepID=UPI001C4F5443|nr:C-terminal binding protein AN-like [Macadamia integrifolia]